MALGKTIGEIRALPYPEYLGWQRFYAIEPWGWQNDEYQTAAILAMLVNVNQGKKARAKGPKDFFRDMIGAIKKAIEQRGLELAFENMTPKEKSEYRIKMAKQLFGEAERKIDKRKIRK